MIHTRFSEELGFENQNKGKDLTLSNKLQWTDESSRIKKNLRPTVKQHGANELCMISGSAWAMESQSQSQNLNPVGML